MTFIFFISSEIQLFASFSDSEVGNRWLIIIRLKSL